ncbi:hypothetical protein A3I56_00320 [Candidatus Roizmanbacteria bacterium RIFCSPLOWO2_02_FULL_43_10]|uniref:Addiction module toxin RelE n=3 Tax=Candidatus Roizmaniibacteriota TaxID=1752723 RepID=A0A1F7JU81_9BACT|nr:MAG: hypothetical protein A3D08_00655 [Candidatus Roizmanbacteria bacterium RIFCSPHIGHO2_02_FULL_43_11]OGK59167.1 MAG: hypothetical protein A3I56_00320 [Candidatus Roizmanbacteria bacterium RIFCSPLOWO2_02_FULL_43_10]
MYSIYLYKSRTDRPIIEKFIDSMDKDMQVRVRNAMRLLQTYGLVLLHNDFVRKIHQHPDIYELRLKGSIHIRLLFFLYNHSSFVIVHGYIKKSQKLPRRDIDIALKRVREFE